MSRIIARVKWDDEYRMANMPDGNAYTTKIGPAYYEWWLGKTFGMQVGHAPSLMGARIVAAMQVKRIRREM